MKKNRLVRFNSNYGAFASRFFLSIRRAIFRSFALFFSVGFLFLLGSCSHKETRILPDQRGALRLMAENAKREIKVTKETVIFDARQSFEYTMAHLPGSQNLTWTRFAQNQGPFPGLVTEETQNAQRTLALKGVGPDTPVIVVGEGLKGRGEEGRLAWTLFYLGLNDVQFVDIRYFGQRLTNVQSLQSKNAPDWKSPLRESVLADREEVFEAVSQAQSGKDRIFLIDVRSEKEYMDRKGFGQGYTLPDLQSINIPWDEFFTKMMRPNLNLAMKLESIGILKDQRIIVLSQQGVRSGAVTMALLAMGYKNASNYAGGLNHLSKRWQN